MVFLRWLGGIVVFFWILGLIFRIGGSMIHWLLLIAAVVWLFSWITGRKV